MNEEEVKRLLKEITAFHIIQYSPQNDEPQIIFRKNRVPVDDFSMDLTAYNKRKEAFIRRVMTMIDYTKSTGCRSSFINQYFGDLENQQCGICDNCLRKGSDTLSPQEFEEISDSIVQHLNQSSLTLAELLVKLYPVQKFKARKAIRFLQAEQKIKTDEYGRILLVI
jgi:ATP-dependent DNA helicase RecQ